MFPSRRMWERESYAFWHMLAKDGVSTLWCDTWVGARNSGKYSQAFVDAGFQVREILHAEDVDLILGLECRSDLVGELSKCGWRLAKMIQLARQGCSSGLGASHDKNITVCIQFLLA